MVKAKEAMGARSRARKAKAELDAKRAEQDRLVLDAATAFYEATEAADAARAALATAEGQRAASVTTLGGLGQSNDEIATLCGITAKEVRDLRKNAVPPKRAPVSASAGADAGAGEQSDAQSSSDAGSRASDAA